MWQGFITLVVVYIAAVWKCNVRTVVHGIKSAFEISFENIVLPANKTKT